MSEGMLTYKIHWEKDEADGTVKSGSFLSTGLTDDDCIQGGEKEVTEFGGIVTDYYQVSPSTDALFKGFKKIIEKTKA